MTPRKLGLYLNCTRIAGVMIMFLIISPLKTRYTLNVYSWRLSSIKTVHLLPCVLGKGVQSGRSDLGQKRSDNPQIGQIWEFLRSYFSTF